MATVSPTNFFLLESSMSELEQLMMEVDAHCKSREAKPLQTPTQ